MRTRLVWTISYKSLYFVHPSLEVVPLFTGMRERSMVWKTSLFPFIEGRKPTIIKTPVNQSAHIGSNVTFNCTVSGDPAPLVNWTKDGNLLPFNQKVLTNLTTVESQLVIRGVTMNDTGKYRCVASNSMGTERSKAAVLSLMVVPEGGMVMYSLTSYLPSLLPSFLPSIFPSCLL